MPQAPHPAPSRLKNNPPVVAVAVFPVNFLFFDLSFIKRTRLIPNKIEIKIVLICEESKNPEKSWYIDLPTLEIKGDSPATLALTTLKLGATTITIQNKTEKVRNNNTLLRELNIFKNSAAPHLTIFIFSLIFFLLILLNTYTIGVGVAYQ